MPSRDKISAPLVRGLINSFHRRKPVRAGSLIITLYGDAIVPRGGKLWLGSIGTILELFRIDGGHVRTAISRLASEKWLERYRSGRNSFYRLSRFGEGAFADATKRIYFFHERGFTGSISLALLSGETNGRAEQRESLQAAGYAALNAFTYVSATGEGGTPSLHEGVRFFEIPFTEDAVSILKDAYHLDEIAGSYQEFVARFKPIAEALKTNFAPNAAEALVIRLLLIQEFRRIVLRDPALPEALLPSPWPGREARKLAAGIYRAVLKPSEQYLDLCRADEAGPLPKPNSSLAQRFAGSLAQQ